MGRIRQVNNNFYNEDYMTFEECLDTIKELSRSQGFYGRLYRDIMELEEEQLEELKKTLEAQKFTDSLDLIMYLEG